MRVWVERREGKSAPQKRPGITVNRRDLISSPVPKASLLWNGLHVRRSKSQGSERDVQNIRIDVVQSGITNGENWECGLEFDFSNEESIICCPIRKAGYEDKPVAQAEFSEIPSHAMDVRFALLQPMSGITATEPLLQPGRVNALMGQAETA